MKSIMSCSLSQNFLHTLKTKKKCFSRVANSLFPSGQGLTPALLVVQPLVHGHDVPVSAAAAHCECRQLLCFPTLLEPSEGMITGTWSRGHSPSALWKLVLYLLHPISSQAEFVDQLQGDAQDNFHMPYMY